MAEKASVREVGLRDGLQLAKDFLDTQIKLEWARAEAAAGVREIEVTSFVPPHVIAQFSDAGTVASTALTIPGLLASALIPNLRGAQTGFDLGVAKLNFVCSASEAHNQANVRRSTDESLADFDRIMDERKARGLDGKTAIAGGIATSFGCTIQGAVPEERVLAIASAYAEAGADEIMVADTVGYANPNQVRRILAAVVREVAPLPVAAHFHDTRGLGLANVVAALDAGVRLFDSSLAGLGGCPFAPGASGNINTEDCVYLLESMGFDTGVDLDALLRLRERLPQWLPQEKLTGAIERAGLPKTFVCAHAA
ncbi:hydroxymethylglutaryl-CoA lyase [Nitratireductor indicus]|uniref:Hydroxymethylglutaryl-CoA lyase n=1 Tax=Nitratireductor indicus C115 TaxID=1231190 RepID=K2N6T0_9HYPH|nr:hydroxymethylglutaryl-CoA lyase [Nitratireductor indicus]EKF43183.1 hydroxymethylglutaryl-CoA lyase [Nitratireductor indicus C115]MDS1137737.1 hydroxymethylglutaryl-CoA lyase [Nitratireductor indicus]SFQ53476.1 hydroxymethylglutaryl-CoA lyase [Nitratireductor indicus]